MISEEYKKKIDIIIDKIKNDIFDNIQAEMAVALQENINFKSDDFDTEKDALEYMWYRMRDKLSDMDVFIEDLSTETLPKKLKIDVEDIDNVIRKHCRIMDVSTDFDRRNDKLWLLFDIQSTDMDGEFTIKDLKDIENDIRELIYAYGVRSNYSRITVSDNRIEISLDVTKYEVMGL